MLDLRKKSLKRRPEEKREALPVGNTWLGPAAKSPNTVGESCPWKIAPAVLIAAVKPSSLSSCTCNSKCSGRTKCDRTDDNITDSDLNADVQAWSDIVQCWEIANLSTSSRYSDRSSIDSHTSFRSEGEPNFLDEEHDTIAV